MSGNPNSHPFRTIHVNVVDKQPASHALRQRNNRTGNSGNLFMYWISKTLCYEYLNDLAT